MLRPSKGGLPVVGFQPFVDLAKTEDEAVKIANEIGFPVVLKLLPPDVNHRESVSTILNSAEEVRRVYQKILKNAGGHLEPDALGNDFSQGMF